MKRPIELLAGEKPIKNAPPIELSNGENCIPQHYLIFEHTLESVELIVLQVEFDRKYPIFVSQDDQGLFIQVGVVGYDNFKPRSQQMERKIVYGRRWRVEQQLPTSEIIQTIFLAIKTAREHEIRELFQLTVDGRTTTPFNNHHDLPLMVRQQSQILNSAKLQIDEKTIELQNIEKALAKVSNDFSSFELIDCNQTAGGQWLVDIQINTSIQSELEELNEGVLSLIVSALNENEVLYQLISSLIDLSNRWIEENFCYRGYARFSRQNQVSEIARLSSRTRKTDHLEHEQQVFLKRFEQANYYTDLTRVPKMHQGDLSKKLKNSLHQFGRLNGLLPVD